MINSLPHISVIMSVNKNINNYLSLSIESIINQSFINFEFIIINDGANKDVRDILNIYKKKDKRIKVHEVAKSGLTKSLNIAINLSKGKFIARQDYDDISLPMRLEKQFKLLNTYKYFFCSTNSYKINSKNKIIGSIINNNSYEKAKKIFEYKNFITHSSVCFNKDIISIFGLYNENFITSQDYELWTRIISFKRMYFMQDKLIKLRIHNKSISFTKNFLQRKYSLFIGLKYKYNFLEKYNKNINDNNVFEKIAIENKENKELIDMLYARKYVYLYDQIYLFSIFNYNFNVIKNILKIYLFKPNYFVMRFKFF